jgi:Kef-type K+ transport system membrane component KefB
LSDIGVTIFFLELAILSIFARLFGEVARRLLVPTVVGELSVGVILGPTLLQRFFPTLQQAVFPSQGDAHTALATILSIGAIFFLLAAGMEVDLRLVRRSGRLAIPISLSGVIVPFLIASIPIYFHPELVGLHAGPNQLIPAMFMGACCSVTALPILGRILLDLDLFKTAFGMLILSSAVLDDFIGWIIVGIVLALNQGQAGEGVTIQKIMIMIGETIAFVILLMTVGRWFCSRVISIIYKISTDSGRVICFIMAIGLLSASCTTAIGIHGPLGAFMAGVVIGSSNIKEETRHSIEDFVKSFFAPVYFAAVGLSVDFVANFSWQTVLVVITIACLGKIGGCFFAARCAKLPVPISLGIGLAMNTRGSVEIILATIGVQAGIIDDHIFVALTLMAVTTSCIAGWTLRAMAETLRGDSALEIKPKPAPVPN